MIKIFLSIFLYNGLKKINLFNNLSLDDTSYDDRWTTMIQLNTNKTITRPINPGFDERFNKNEFYNLEKIMNNLNRYKLLKKLNYNISIYNKLESIDTNNGHSTIKINNGGLMNDWDLTFEDFLIFP
jgi:hypothetical protein